jgi:probable rRNA maturation factor
MEKKLNLLARKILKTLNQRNATLDIFLLPHAEIKKLKARFIKKQTEPNVLAFREPIAFPHPELSAGARGKRSPKYLGEVFLNADILKKSPERAAPLLLHGILHLLGYDHKKNADAEKMEALEGEVLGRI